MWCGGEVIENGHGWNMDGFHPGKTAGGPLWLSVGRRVGGSLSPLRENAARGSLPGGGRSKVFT